VPMAGVAVKTNGLRGAEWTGLYRCRKAKLTALGGGLASNKNEGREDLRRRRALADANMKLSAGAIKD
jgi:hypothetical protein